MCDKPLTQADLRELATAAPERLYVDWVELPGTLVEVTAQPVRLDGADGPIVPVSARTAQCFADLLDAYCTTAAIEDLLWKHSTVKIPPFCMTDDGSWEQGMRWWRHMQAELEQRRVGPKTLVSFADKAMINHGPCPAGLEWEYGIHVLASDCNHTPEGATYAGMKTYPTVTPTLARVVNYPMHAHGNDEADYSQHARLWRPQPGVDPRHAHPIEDPPSLRLSGL